MGNDDMKKRRTSERSGGGGSSSSKHRHVKDDTSSSAVLEAHGYVLGRTVGRGSYATVKVARTPNGDTVAIKVVSKFHAPEEYLRKFLPREIDAVKGLRHPNLIRFIQAIETTHRVYIIMEYAENGTLLEAIRRQHYIEEDRARRWFRQLVDVVEYCHNNGVVHRDIKCDNLLLNRDDSVKLSDFGFARANMSPRLSGTCPLSETFCGSFAYAAPEVLRGVPYYPHAADVWSMGVVLFAMVFGKLPFDDTNHNLLLKQVQHKVVFPRSPQVSSHCKDLINKILSPSRQRADIPAIKKDPWYQAAISITTPSSPTKQPQTPTTATTTTTTTTANSAAVKVSIKKPANERESSSANPKTPASPKKED